MTMAYKTILTHLDGSPALTERVKLAAELAKKHEAHFVGLAPTGIATVPGDGYLSMTVDLIADLQEQLDKSAREAISVFEKVSKDFGVNAAESRMIGNTPVDTVLLQARYSDLVVIGQAATHNATNVGSQGFVEQVILGAGRPVLIVPNVGSFRPVGARVLFSWDASREAARAASDAMPILKDADLVEVLVINPESGVNVGHGPQPGTDIALFLARHGVNAQVRNLQSDMDVGNTLLSHAADFGADLIVMGGYGHSRLREWVLGGTTRTLLNSMTVPVLMSH
ncbi:MAG: universal stress protein [Burkholderiaceae bacterium]